MASIAIVLGLAACNGDETAAEPVECGDGGMATCTANRPQCASETVKCISGYCVYAPRSTREGAVCKCYGGQIVGCSPVSNPSDWAQDVGVRMCNVVGDFQADWDPFCAALAKDAGAD